MRTLLTLTLISSGSAMADGSLTERDRVFEFLSKNVIGRTVKMEMMGQNPDKTLEYDFKRISQYGDLEKTERGLTYKKIVTINQKNYDLGPDGKRVPGKAPKIEDRSVVEQVAVQQMHSNDKLVGISTIVNNTRHDPTGHGNSTRLILTNGVLEERTTTPLYADMFYKDGAFKPGQSEGSFRYELDNGKLKVTDRIRSGYVNPDTLQADGEKRTNEAVNLEP